MIEVILLGTGSAAPTNDRHLSGVALIRQGEIFLFDCGEGTQMQFRKAGLRPGKLRYIFISHLHGDHLFGLPGLLTSLHMAGCQQRVELFGPEGITEYIRFHQELCQFTLGYPLQIHEITETTPPVLWRSAEYHVEWQPLEHGIFTAGFAFVEANRPGRFDVHRAEQLGVPNGPERGRLQRGESIVLPDGRRIYPEEVLGPPRPGVKMAYCLDTVPCTGAEKLAANADLLIADSTFSSADAEHAHETGHSTAVDAAELARRCGVRQLLLTHFSGRLGQEDLPALVAEATAIFPNSVAATDLARFVITARE
ncbi:MAG: ribonuclease Z [candidate division KSB1 bacterium]|nr:ribonuclease Z [candidate division KSB1 bacterium]MDZ7303906.1 ribonuclease Z [candidate division KSB1 bacterium]MDZ7313067.1 ribonuclease Z [candidate division KSB1 bacterium]